ncbi:MAG: NUDIX hydrolase [Candidatus Saliniplasma sp.]
MEYLDVVNEENEVIDQRPRNEVHEKGLPHRTVMFLVRSEDGKILVTKRSYNKEFFPGYWSIVLGGHVQSGSSYEEALKKEMKEEIGVVGEYKKILFFVKDIPEETEYANLYETVVDPADINLIDEEFEKGEFWEKSKIMEELEKRDFLPETYHIIDHLE